MAYKRDDDYTVSETGNWNVASEYARLKIMKPLYLSDEYANIATFGTATLMEELQYLNVPIDTMKLAGFKRLVNILLLLIDNTLFAAKKETQLLKDYKEKLERIKKITPLLSNTVTNGRTGKSKTTLETEKYEKVLEEVLNIKSLINYPLNKNHLIFTETEEFDPVEYKRKVIEQATTRG